MVMIPAGVLTMGSSDLDLDVAVNLCKRDTPKPHTCKRRWYEDESPRTQITMRAYAMHRTEVTVTDYMRCYDQGQCAAPVQHHSDDPAFNWGAADRLDHPINGVTRAQAATYCTWAGGRLPTEAEWEYGARGATTRRFPWGNTPPGMTSPGLGNFADESLLKLDPKLARCLRGLNDGFAHTSPVGLFKDGISPFGLLDMAGNVWEWTADGYGPYGARDPHTPFAGEPDRNVGAAKGVARGGGYDRIGSAVRSTIRWVVDPEKNMPALGFRCVKDLE